MAQSITFATAPIENQTNGHLVEEILRERMPNRNEKYYYILLSSWHQLTSETAKTEITADAIIKSFSIARPTWYSYFKSVQHYYKDVIDIMGNVTMEYAMNYLRENAKYDNWSSFADNARMLIFLSNTKSLSAYFPDLHDLWLNFYKMMIEEYANILGPMLKLSPSRTRLLIKTIANEFIVHKEKYLRDRCQLDRFVNREYALFLSEQNN